MSHVDGSLEQLFLLAVRAMDQGASDEERVAFEALFTEVEKRLISWASRELSRRASRGPTRHVETRGAELIARAAFTRAVKARPEWRGETRFYGFLRTAVRSEIRDDSRVAKPFALQAEGLAIREVIDNSELYLRRDGQLRIRLGRRSFFATTFDGKRVDLVEEVKRARSRIEHRIIDRTLTMTDFGIWIAQEACRTVILEARDGAVRRFVRHRTRSTRHLWQLEQEFTGRELDVERDGASLTQEQHEPRGRGRMENILTLMDGELSDYDRAVFRHCAPFFGELKETDYVRIANEIGAKSGDSVESTWTRLRSRVRGFVALQWAEQRGRTYLEDLVSRFADFDDEELALFQRCVGTLGSGLDQGFFLQVKREMGFNSSSDARDSFRGVLLKLMEFDGGE